MISLIHKRMTMRRLMELLVALLWIGILVVMFL